MGRYHHLSRRLLGPLCGQHRCHSVDGARAAELLALFAAVTEIGEDLTGPGAGQDAGKLKHANARERALLRTGHFGRFLPEFFVAAL